MKADLTKPEVRAAFMAQYLYQPVFVHKNGHPVPVEVTGRLIFDNDIQDGYLSLRHISSLTEEEMKELILFVTGRVATERPEWVRGAVIEFTFEYKQVGETFVSQSILVMDHKMLSQTADWLRERSFLIPYRGNSCEELIEAGLAVYRKDETT